MYDKNLQIVSFNKESGKGFDMDINLATKDEVQTTECWDKLIRDCWEDTSTSSKEIEAIAEYVADRIKYNEPIYFTISNTCVYVTNNLPNVKDNYIFQK